MDTAGTNVIRISTSHIPEHNRLGTACELYGRTILKHDIEPIGDRPFAFEATLWALPGLGLGLTEISPCRAPLGLRHIDSDDLVFNVGLTGRGRVVHQRGREVAIAASQAVLTTSADPGVATILSDSRHFSLRIPRAIFESQIADLDASLLRPIAHNAPALMLLSGYLQTIWRIGAPATPELRDKIVAHIHDLVLLTLGAKSDARGLAEQRGLRAARRAAVLRAIDRGSDDPDLSALAVAEQLGITPRYVHLLLEETGRSFTHHVLQKRLEKAAALLRDPRWRGRKIADVAFEAGFTDLSYFNRSFRRHFGATPSDVRAAAWRDSGP
jgi:AraC-like DNA-binding protein